MSPRRWPAAAAALLLLAAGHPGSGRVAGTVTSAAGLPVAGAHVRAEGSRWGVATRQDGRYALMEVPPGVRRVTARDPRTGAEAWTEVTVASDSTSRADMRLP